MNSAPSSKNFFPSPSGNRLGRILTRGQLLSDESDAFAHASSPTTTTFGDLYSNYNNSHAEHNRDFPVHRAAAAGDLTELRRLCSSGAQVNTPGHLGRRAVHYAAIHGHWEVLEDLLVRFKANVAAKDAFGRTALHSAVGGTATSMVEVSIVRLLLDKGASGTAQDENGDTPLHRAVCKARLGTVRVLVGGSTELDGDGSDLAVRMKNGLGKTPLQCAMGMRTKNSEAIVACLLGAGARIGSEDLVIEVGEDVDVEDVEPRTSPVPPAGSKKKQRKPKPSLMIATEHGASGEPNSARGWPKDWVDRRATPRMGSATPTAIRDKIRGVSRSIASTPRTPLSRTAARTTTLA